MFAAIYMYLGALLLQYLLHLQLTLKKLNYSNTNEHVKIKYEPQLSILFHWKT